MDFKVRGAAFTEGAGQQGFVRAVDLLDVEDEFIQLVGIVVDLAQFDLPRADIRGVIEQVFQFIEINQRTFDLVKIHRPHFGAAGDITNQSWQLAAAMRTRFIKQTAIDEVAGPITHDYTAAGVERCEHQFARLARRERRAGLRINNLHDAEVRIKMVTAGRLVVWEWTFGPGEFGFGEPVGGYHVEIASAQLEREIA